MYTTSQLGMTKCRIRRIQRFTCLNGSHSSADSILIVALKPSVSVNVMHWSSSGSGSILLDAERWISSVQENVFARWCARFGVCFLKKYSFAIGLAFTCQSDCRATYRFIQLSELPCALFTEPSSPADGFLADLRSDSGDPCNTEGDVFTERLDERILPPAFPSD
eukprot:scaffold2544_cov245-Pinguiococcus_pyrenoidosus.AAC.16